MAPAVPKLRSCVFLLKRISPFPLGEIVRFPSLKVVISAVALEKISPVEPIVLFVKVCACFSNTNVSVLLVRSGIVITELARVGAILLIVVVFPVPTPNTIWFKLEVKFNAPLNVMPPNVGVADVLMFCGSEKVTLPTPELLTLIWLVVPIAESTPVLAIEILPLVLVTDIPLPVERLAEVYP